MHKIRYVFLIILITSSAFSMGFKGEINKLFSKIKRGVDRVESQIPAVLNNLDQIIQNAEEKVDDVYSVYTAAQLPGIVARNMVYTAFSYSQDKGHYEAPKYKNKDLDHVLKNDFLFQNMLERFRGIVQSYDINVTPSSTSEDQWRDLHGILALEHAVYPKDKQCSRKEIDEDIKQIMAIRCLLCTNPDFLKKENIDLKFDTRVFEIAEAFRAQHGEQPMGVIVHFEAQEESEPLLHPVAVVPVEEVLPAPSPSIAPQEPVVVEDNRVEIDINSEDDALESVEIVAVSPLLVDSEEEDAPQELDHISSSHSKHQDDDL